MNAQYRCFRGCEGEIHPLHQEIYRCGACGGLLDVVHDAAALGEVGPQDWMDRFDARFGRVGPETGSGVWRFREWVLPEISDDAIVSLGEGGTPLVHARRFGREAGLSEVWVKQCGSTHSGSFKDLGMTVLVSQVQQIRQQGGSLSAVGCASTGDTSAALSAYCASASLPAVVFLPADKISLAQLVQPIANGALVLSLDTDFDGCMALIQEVVQALPIYLANSMNSLRLEGQKTVAFEIVQQLGWEAPDWVVVPGGNLGNVYALYKGFDLLKTLGIIDRLPRLACAQAAQANPLYRAFEAGWDSYAPVRAGSTLASAIQIGDPVSIERAIRAIEATDGVVEQATEQALSDACARADRSGLFTCPHTGVALAALLSLRERGIVGSDDRIVVISTAHGLKFADTKVAYHRSDLEGVESTLANPPVRLRASLGDVVDALGQHLGLAPR